MLLIVITIKHKGNFNKTERLFGRILKRNYKNVLEKYGQLGLEALSSATPKDSGKTASSWRYEVTFGKHSISVTWLNDNINDGVNIALILQYGHGTGNGGYVRGRDYINPAIQPIFDAMADEAWKEVVS